jgi:hypothetical protein
MEEQTWFVGLATCAIATSLVMVPVFGPLPVVIVAGTLWLLAK